MSAIGGLPLVAAAADDHVEIILQHGRDHARRGGGFVGRVAIGHDIDVGVDVREHAAHDMALALLADTPDDRAGGGGELTAAVAAVIVEHINVGMRQGSAEVLHRLHDGAGFIIAGQKDGDARGGRAGFAVHCGKVLHRLLMPCHMRATAMAHHD